MTEMISDAYYDATVFTLRCCNDKTFVKISTIRILLIVQNF